MNVKLTENQKEIYLLIKRFMKAQKRTPTIRELQKISQKTYSVVWQRVQALIKKGYLKRGNDINRTLHIIENNFLERNKVERLKGKVTLKDDRGATWTGYIQLYKKD